MPSIRVGFSSDLNITGGNTGIGTAIPTARLEVSNGIVAERAAGGGGISTFKEYQGFNQTLATLPHEIATEEGVFSSLTGEIKITGETTVSSGSTVEVGKTKTLTVTDRFAAPLGETNNRDLAPEAGTTRFNQDFGTLEFFDGANWKTVNSYSRGGAAGRGFSAGGNNPAVVNTISYVTISTLGNAQDFGDLYDATTELSGTAASSTRGVIGGGRTPSHTDVISYITMASEGNSIDFGNLDRGRLADGLSNSTRGIFFNGFNPAAAPTGYGGNTNVIEYIEIATTGNAKDFGDSSQVKRAVGSGCASPTRGVFGGGFTGNLAAITATIDFVTIPTLGDATDFGDLTGQRTNLSGCSNSIRGVFIGGMTGTSPYTYLNTIEYVTIATTGNSANFGDLSTTNRDNYACASPTRGVAAGRYDGSTRYNVIEYIIINTEGNSVDFGDLTGNRAAGGACSNAHGGL